MLEVPLNVILLYLPPYLDHSVPLGLVSQKVHDILIHTMPVSRVTIDMLRLSWATTLKFTKSTHMMFRNTHLLVRMSGNMA